MFCFLSHYFTIFFTLIGLFWTFLLMLLLLDIGLSFLFLCTFKTSKHFYFWKTQMFMHLQRRVFSAQSVIHSHLCSIQTKLNIKTWQFIKSMSDSLDCFIKSWCLGKDQWQLWAQRPFRKRKRESERDLIASVCLGPFQKSDPHGHNRHICMDRSPKANQGTNTLPIFPPDEAWAANRGAEMKESERAAERDCWLTSAVGCKSVHREGETEALALHSYLSTKAISQGFLSAAAVFKQQQVGNQFGMLLAGHFL